MMQFARNTHPPSIVLIEPCVCRLVQAIVVASWVFSGIVIVPPLLHLMHFKELIIIRGWLFIHRTVQLHYLLVMITTHPFIQSKGDIFIHSDGFSWKWLMMIWYSLETSHEESQTSPTNLFPETYFVNGCYIYFWEHHFFHKADSKSHQKQLQLIVDCNHAPSVSMPFPFVVEMAIHFLMACLWQTHFATTSNSSGGSTFSGTSWLSSLISNPHAWRSTKSSGIRATLPSWMVVTAWKIEAHTSSFSLSSASGGKHQEQQEGSWLLLLWRCYHH